METLYQELIYVCGTILLYALMGVAKKMGAEFRELDNFAKAASEAIGLVASIRRNPREVVHFLSNNYKINEDEAGGIVSFLQSPAVEMLPDKEKHKILMREIGGNIVEGKVNKLVAKLAQKI
jgi:hypothetical protein